MPKKNTVAAVVPVTPAAKRGDCAACGKRRVLPFTPSTSDVAKQYGGDVCKECHAEGVAASARAVDAVAQLVDEAAAPSTEEKNAVLAQLADAAPADEFAAAFGTDAPTTTTTTTDAPAEKKPRVSLPSPFMLSTIHKATKDAGGDPLVAMRAVLDTVPAGVRRKFIMKSRTKVEAGSAVDVALRQLHDEMPAASTTNSGAAGGRGRHASDRAVIRATMAGFKHIRIPAPAQSLDVGEVMAFSVEQVSDGEWRVTFKRTGERVTSKNGEE
jgi:hypothetical protein